MRAAADNRSIVTRQEPLDSDVRTPDVVSSLQSQMPSDMRAKDTFWVHLTAELLDCCHRHEKDNTDHLRFSEPLSLKATVKQKLVDVAASLGFHRPPDVQRAILQIPDLDQAYGLLEDQPSKDLLIKLLVYRILGSAHVRLPLNNLDYWRQRRSLSQHIVRENTIQVPVLGALGLYNINCIRLHTHPIGLMNTFILEQYRCRRADVHVCPGDIVVDAGGCWGDTALYFADSAQHVYCFECMPSNIAIIHLNLALNPELARKISVVEKALWNQSGETLQFGDLGPGSRRVAGDGTTKVQTQTLDDFVSKNLLEKIDFIKMDIEGAEPEALRGAEETIRKYRPKLAISIYHDPRHLACIPRWLASLDAGYRFWLDHFTIHHEETVLFARSDA